ncbi:Hypothetical protein TJEJU_2746 [Tenacibaculum jejuense]|uniref:Uncharacterized protein n=2 Tax=Tenacibaculum jejuense TaxID=584609 RepID=A0A238UBH9_9FLAO|nr:Hypothetical protein TJEJU_2746 [Tenacibaculum jejuense]
MTPFIVWANMAKPWSDAAVNSVLISDGNCIVLKENIDIRILPSNEHVAYIASYRVVYLRKSEVSFKKS